MGKADTSGVNICMIGNKHMKNDLQLTVHGQSVDYQQGIAHIIEALDARRGMYLSSGIEYPGRYTRWDLGFVDPPLELIASGRSIEINVLTARGQAWLAILQPLLLLHDAVELSVQSDLSITLQVAKSTDCFTEEQRSQQPSVVTPLRSVIQALKQPDLSAFGFYGAFGYELIFQFDEINLSAPRQGDEKIYHLYFVDDIYLLDRRKEQAEHVQLEAQCGNIATKGVANTIYQPLTNMPETMTVGQTISHSHDDQQYADLVEVAREQMRIGNVFELVFSRKLSVPFSGPGSAVFSKMKQLNPSPYEFFCQFGDEQLIGTSPEMFVRVTGDRIETCPISGAIRRGQDAMEDEKRIRDLLNSYKDEVELSMCTDVDRNDKSRICVPGSVRLLSRRSIERYVGLFHTVDHVEGQLLPQYDALDGFLSHMWAVTLTGAPKHQAVQLIEQHEGSSRRWYGGAVGALRLDGDINSCITIRTIHFQNQQAHYRVGATLVWDSVGQAEVDETHAKATPFYRALGLKDVAAPHSHLKTFGNIGQGYQAVMVDNQDSFVHTLADYFRQCGMQVTTYRAGTPLQTLLDAKPDLIIHSPGPKMPADFGVPALVRQIVEQGIPQFGVCLGLQGIVEAFGGKLILLDQPMHGKTWYLDHNQQGLMAGIDMNCAVAAYHSIIADKHALPDCLEIIAENEQGDVMAIRHRDLPIQAVQFHPESILSFQNQAGLQMVASVIQQLVGAR